MSDIQRIQEMFLKLLAAMASAGLNTDSDDFVALTECLTMSLHDLTDALTYRLRTHASLNDIEEVLQKIWEKICDIHGRDETKVWILYPRYCVDLLMRIVKTDPFHTMSKELRSIAQSKPQMDIMATLGDGVPRSPAAICSATGFTSDEVRLILLMFVASNLVKRSKSGKVIQYELNQTSKAFLANARSCAGEAHGLAAS